MIQCLVFFVIAVLYRPRVWTQVLYAVLEWIFNYQNNGGRHGTGKMSTRLPHDLFLEILCIGEEGERKGRILPHWSLTKTQKNNKENASPKALGAAVFATGEAGGNYMELVQASLLWVGGIVLCTVAHLGRDDRGNVLFFAMDCSEVCLGILCDAKIG